MRALIATILLVTSSMAFGHAGGLNANGCHNKKGGGYHCHSNSSRQLEKINPLKEIKRPSRSQSEREAFMRSNPCPVNGNTSGPCAGYHVDHIKPLACGGADNVSNMQWLTASANLIKGSMGCRYSADSVKSSESVQKSAPVQKSYPRPLVVKKSSPAFSGGYVASRAPSEPVKAKLQPIEKESAVNEQSSVQGLRSDKQESVELVWITLGIVFAISLVIYCVIKRMVLFVWNSFKSLFGIKNKGVN